MKKGIRNHILNYLAEDKSGHISSELEEWLAENSAHPKLLEQFKRIWMQSRVLFGIKRIDVQRAWENVDSELQSRRRLKRRIRSLTYVSVGTAASILIVLGLFLFTNLFPSKELMLSVTTANGSRTETILPDGTVVALNAGSSLSYRFNDRKRIREILQFNGEGYFEVARDKIPFVINTKEGYSIKVLGTKFNLTAYGEENNIVTSLVEGSVEVKSPENKKIMLKSGETINYDKTAKKLELLDTDIAYLIGWRSNKLYMDDMPLRTVARTMERWYDVIIEFEDERMGEKYHYTGVIHGETIYEVMDALAQLSNVKYRSTGRKIILSEKQ